MSSRDEAVKVGHQALETHYGYEESRLVMDAAITLDAAHKAGLISYQDELEPIWIGGVLHFRFVPRRVSFEAGEEVNEEQT